MPGNPGGPGQTHTIFLVEDDLRLAALVRDYLQQQGFQVLVEHWGDRASRRILDEKPDLVILDLMLPGRDGFDVCRDIRKAYLSPVLMLTAKDEDVDEVVGLELGADDYVSKPVQPRLLLARIRALLRRSGIAVKSAPHHSSAEHSFALTFGTFQIDRRSREVLLAGHAVTLTTNEFELLWVLAASAGEVLSRDHPLGALRGIGYDGLDRSVDIAVSRLRKKLGDSSGAPQRIKTVRGRGYLFVYDAWD